MRSRKDWCERFTAALDRMLPTPFDRDAEPEWQTEKRLRHVLLRANPAELTDVGMVRRWDAWREECREKARDA